MAGYQNEKGYSGKDVDRILQDHDIKATTTLLSLNPNGTVNLEGFPHGDTFPNAKYSYVGTTIKFMYDDAWVTAEVIGVTEVLYGFELLLFFHKGNFYKMIITVNTGDWANGTYSITTL